MNKPISDKERARDRSALEAAFERPQNLGHCHPGRGEARTPRRPAARRAADPVDEDDEEPQRHAARLPNLTRLAFCLSLRGGSLNSRAAVPPRMLCLPFSETNGRS